VREATIIEVGDDACDFPVPMLARPVAGGGVVVESVKAEIDKYRPHPERRRGTARLLDLASFIAHACRFKDADSAVFVTEEPATFTAVLNYHEAVNGSAAGEPASAMPRFGDHRGTYAPETSSEWKAWTENDGEWIEQADFAALISDNARDIFDVDANHPDALGELAAWYANRFARGVKPAEFFASTQRLLDLAEGLSVTVEDRVSDVTKLSGGDTKIAFESKATPDVEVPVALCLAIPVFTGGDLYQVPARLRYKLFTSGDTKRVAWRIDLYGTDRTMRQCVADMRATVNAGTGLPSFLGSPE